MGRIERVTWKHIHYHVQNRGPVGICCRIQGAQIQCSVTTERGGMGWEVGGRFKRDGTCIYLGLIHVALWWKPTQHCKTIILQLKIIVKKQPTSTSEEVERNPQSSQPLPDPCSHHTCSLATGRPLSRAGLGRAKEAGGPWQHQVMCLEQQTPDTPMWALRSSTLGKRSPSNLYVIHQLRKMRLQMK